MFARALVFKSLLFSTFLFWCLPVFAHPHVWVSAAASFHFNQSELLRIGMRWQFDPFFSQVLITDFDLSGDGLLDESETLGMKQQIFTSLREFDYFTHVNAGEKEVQFTRVESFFTEQKDGELVFVFDLVMEEPIDVSVTPVTLSLYDPSIYIDIMFFGDTPVKVLGAGGAMCSWKFTDGAEVQSESWFVTPQQINLTCGGR